MYLRVQEGEPLHPVVRAIELATGRRPHKSCAYRWMLTGIRHPPLAYVMLGGQRMTSVECVHRWISFVTAARGKAPTYKGSQQRTHDIAHDDQDLANDGW